MSASNIQQLRLAGFAEELQGKGRLCFTKQEAMKALGISAPAFGKAAHRLIQHTKLMRIRNNFYAIIPPEYRTSEGLPATFYIDTLMKFNEQPYYVGVLSAAALHGAAHQAPQELQVVTSKPLSVIQAGRSRVRFLTKKTIQKTPTQPMKTPTGFIQVSTPEATAFDLLRYVRAAGHLNNVATVILELAEKFNSTKLIQIARIEGDSSNAQRLGYLLDRFHEGKHAKALHEWLMKQNPSPVFLRPDRRKGVTEQNEKWKILVNTEVEPDL